MGMRVENRTRLNVLAVNDPVNWWLYLEQGAERWSPNTGVRRSQAVRKPGNLRACRCSRVLPVSRVEELVFQAVPGVE